jgi:hypothetical protein
MISAGFDAHKKDTINGGYISLVGGLFDIIIHSLNMYANFVHRLRKISIG